MDSTDILPMIDMYEVKEEGQGLDVPGLGYRHGFASRRIASLRTGHRWDD